ncbi:unnamed protein product [Pleuronectes platessa]|uniref:Uncharacterized protein n=1 Tax=Pleuronectes platessa TaxID=8262 RepID=A0A9N7Y6Q0_PLEPL|nr:unnamed protein product [Pleuronectes platessa]
MSGVKDDTRGSVSGEEEGQTAASRPPPTPSAAAVVPSDGTVSDSLCRQRAQLNHSVTLGNHGNGCVATVMVAEKTDEWERLRDSTEDEEDDDDDILCNPEIPVPGWRFSLSVPRALT